MTILRNKSWHAVSRADSLWFSVISVIIATAMAFGDGIEHIETAVITFFCVITINIGINLTNTYYSLLKKSNIYFNIDLTKETPVVPMRPKALKIATTLIFILAIPACVYLIDRGGLPIAAIIVASIMLGVFYSMGRYPLKNLGLGDIFAFLFFGPVAVSGTYYVQTFEINAAVVLAGLAPGLFGVGFMAVKNMINHERDLQIGKRTLAVRFGKSFAQKEYFFAVICACLTPIIIHTITDDYALSMMAVLTLFFTFPSIKAVLSESNNSQSLEYARTSTIKLLVLYAIFFSLGWISHIVVP